MICNFYNTDNECHSFDLGSKGSFYETISQDFNFINLVNDYRFNDAEPDCIKKVYSEIKDLNLSKLEIKSYDENNSIREFDISNARITYRFSNNNGWDPELNINVMYDREILEIIIKN